MYTLMDTLNYSDFETTIVVVKMMCGDEATIEKIKEVLEMTKMSLAKLSDKLVKSKDSQKGLLEKNNELHLNFYNRERQLQKEVEDLKKELSKERQQIDEWEPQVNLSCDKLSYRLPMGKDHSTACPAFAPIWKKYYKKT